MSLAEIINTGLNNPECAFFVGQYFGQASILQLALVLAGIGYLYKAGDQLALQPLINWIKHRRNKK